MQNYGLLGRFKGFRAFILHTFGVKDLGFGVMGLGIRIMGLGTSPLPQAQNLPPPCLRLSRESTHGILSGLPIPAHRARYPSEGSQKGVEP